MFFSQGNAAHSADILQKCGMDNLSSQHRGCEHVDIQFFFNPHKKARLPQMESSLETIGTRNSCYRVGTGGGVSVGMGGKVGIAGGVTLIVIVGTAMTILLCTQPETDAAEPQVCTATAR